MALNRKFHKSVRNDGERGYILLTLMLFVALLAIAAAAVAPSITFQIKRDREEEMIHRGVQYSRAIRRYFKKTGRFPVRLEDLENTNNIRFLRKRYKDPITGQDFKLLHYGDVKMSFGPGIAGATPPGVPPGVPTLGGPATQSPNNQKLSLFGAAQNAAVLNATQSAQASTSLQPDSSSTTTGSSSSSSSSPGDSSGSASSGTQSSSTSSSSPTGQVFGGGPIVGVASASEKETIREFNKKHHYNEWQFIYDPTMDRGGLLNTPAQPPLQNAVAPAGQTGQPGQPGQSGFGFGSPAGGMGPMNPPPQQPPQQPPSNQPPNN
jgi:hypothetical protein